MRGFFLLFLIFPFLELFLLIRVGSSIGALTTLLLVLASGVIGILCIRLAGLTTALNVRQRMAQGEVPTGDMLNGFLLAMGGVLLFIPGFISDALGVVCLLPMARHWVGRRVSMHMMQGAARAQHFHTQSQSQTHTEQSSSLRQSQTIEGEFERKDS